MSHCDVIFDCPIAKCAIRRRGLAARGARVSVVGSFMALKNTCKPSFGKKIILHVIYLKFLF